MLHADERDVIDLVDHVLTRVARDRRLEFARQILKLLPQHVLVLDLFDRRRRVDDLVLCHARYRGPHDHARHIAARIPRVQSDGLELLPDRRHILDADPVQLDILAVRQVRRGAAVVTGDLPHRARLVRGALSAVETHARHEELVLQLKIVLARVLTAQVLLALRVQTQPLETRVEILIRNRREPLLRVRVDHPLLHLEHRLNLLQLLVVVERSCSIDLPLPLRFRRARRALARSRRSGCHAASSWSLSRHRIKPRDGACPRTDLSTRHRGRDRCDERYTYHSV